MPPLCTVGIGLALGDPGIWQAAGILFVTNLVAIGASATVMFTALRLRPRRSRAGHSGLFLAIGLVIALGFVLVPTAVGVAQQNTAQARSLQFADTVSSTVADVLAKRLPDSTLVSVERSRQGSTLELRVTAQIVSVPSLAAIDTVQSDVAARLGGTVHLVFVGVPVVLLDPASPPPSPSLTPSPTPPPPPTPAPTPTPDVHPDPDADPDAAAEPTEHEHLTGRALPGRRPPSRAWRYSCGVMTSEPRSPRRVPPGAVADAGADPGSDDRGTQGVATEPIASGRDSQGQPVHRGWGPMRGHRRWMEPFVLAMVGATGRPRLRAAGPARRARHLQRSGRRRPGLPNPARPRGAGPGRLHLVVRPGGAAAT